MGCQSQNGAERGVGFWSVAEVAEGEGDFEVTGSEESDDGLEIVAFFSGDPDLTFLEGALHFGAVVLDRFDDLLGLFAVEALFDDEVLGGVT